MSISIGQVSQFINVITNPLFLNVVKKGATSLGVSEDKASDLTSLLENLGKLSSVISEYTGGSSSSSSTSSLSTLSSLLSSSSSSSTSSTNTADTSYANLKSLEGLGGILTSILGEDNINSISPVGLGPLNGNWGLGSLEDLMAFGNFDVNAYVENLQAQSTANTASATTTEQQTKELTASLLYNKLQTASIGSIVDDMLDYSDELASQMDLSVDSTDGILTDFLEKLRQIISKLDEDVKALNKATQDKEVKTVFNKLSSSDSADTKGALTLLA